MSFWLPGQFGSLVAVPLAPGWSLPLAYYHGTSDASGAKNFAIGGRITAGVDGRADLLFAFPTYVFGEPVVGGQLAFGVGWPLADVRVSADATLTGPRGNVLTHDRDGLRNGQMKPRLTRRELLKLVGGAAAGVPVTGLAQTTAQTTTRPFPKGFYWGTGTASCPAGARRGHGEDEEGPRQVAVAPAGPQGDRRGGKEIFLRENRR